MNEHKNPKGIRIYIERAIITTIPSMNPSGYHTKTKIMYALFQKAFLHQGEQTSFTNGTTPSAILTGNSSIFSGKLSWCTSLDVHSKTSDAYMVPSQGDLCLGS